jgi:hypothetical protein
LPIFSYIAGQDVPAGDGEDPFQGGEVRRVRVGEPLSKGAMGEGSGSCCQGFGIGGVNLARQFIEEVIVGAQHIGCAGEKWHRVALGDVTHEGQQLMSDSIAKKSGVFVGEVIHCCDT